MSGISGSLQQETGTISVKPDSKGKQVEYYEKD